MLPENHEYYRAIRGSMRARAVYVIVRVLSRFLDATATDLVRSLGSTLLEVRKWNSHLEYIQGRPHQERQQFDFI